MKTIRIDVKEVEDRRELKVVWNDELPWPAYTIYRPAVERSAREIRRSLRELMSAGLNKTLALERSGRLLKDLARQGAELYQALMTPAGEAAVHPKEIRSYYEQLQEPYALRFCVSNGVFVPWGLVYGANPEALAEDPAEVSADTYSAFWCLSRKLATVYERLPPDSVGRGQDASSLGMLSVVHPNAFEAAKKLLPAEAERDFVDWLQNRFGGPIVTGRDLKRVWREAGSDTGLLYFYCHANASTLALSEEEKIEAAELFLTLAGAERPRPSGRCGCLVLMNGCSTAVGDPASDFLLSTSQAGMCGFVGTETEVPDVFALRFSLSLLELLFREGLTLGDAMQSLYKAHFPLSLLYGLYAHPGFRMPQVLASELPAIGGGTNLSFGQLGTGQLEATYAR